MGIRRFFDKDIVVRRYKTVSGYKKAFMATATVDCALQPLDKQSAQAIDILTDKGYFAWFDVDEDIKEGDRITDENGINYIVREIAKMDYGCNQHLECLIEESNE